MTKSDIKISRLFVISSDIISLVNQTVLRTLRQIMYSISTLIVLQQIAKDEHSLGQNLSSKTSMDMETMGPDT